MTQSLDLPLLEGLPKVFPWMHVAPPGAAQWNREKMASSDTEGGQDTQAGRHQCEKGSRKRALSLEENSEGERVKQQDCTGV